MPCDNLQELCFACLCPPQWHGSKMVRAAICYRLAGDDAEMRLFAASQGISPAPLQQLGDRLKGRMQLQKLR